MLDLQVWRDRYTRLDAYIGDMITRFATLPGNNQLDIPRRKTMLATAKMLRAFAGEHFKYFCDGFEQGKFIPRPKFPAEFIMRQLINHVSEDVEVLERCYENRLVDRAHSPLEIADKLAWAALNPAKKLNLISPETTVITYFGKIASIRTVPYASVALIGVPRTLPGVKIDYLSIPHEVGHYAYWNPLLVDKPRDTIQSQLTKALKGERWWVRHWQEELFADVYGALVARGAITQSFQDLLYETSDEQLRADDAEHPTPVIRPEVYAYVLKKIRAVYPLADALEDRWQNNVKKRKAVLPMTPGGGDVAFLEIKASSDSEPVLVTDEVRFRMQSVLDEILKILKPADFPTDAPVFPREPDDFDLAGQPLRDKFTDIIKDFELNNTIDIQELDATNIVERPWAKWQAAHGMPNLAAVAANNPVLSDKWFEFFRLDGGWATDGPITRPTDNP